MAYNINSGYGALAAQTLTMPTAGKTFYVTDAIGTGKVAQFLQDAFIPDSDGVVRVYSSITNALAACTTGNADAVVIMPDYTTAPTDTELGAAGTKGVMLTFAAQGRMDEQMAMTSNLTLPATATGTLFNVVGVCELISII